MPIIYTDHAEEKIAERKLDKKVIEDTLTNPSTVLEGEFGRHIAQKSVGRKLMRVIYERKHNAYIVITVYYTEIKRYA